jgi:acetyltransferase-like isoleucine patch superfamily enzyme
MRELLKRLARAVALVVMLPALVSFWVRAALMGRDRAIEGSSQAPGVLGQYLRGAFLARALAGCDPTATISFMTVFSQADARIEDHVYVGPSCSLGLVHIGRNALLGSAVHVTSGRHTHGTDSLAVAIRDQPMTKTLVRIGEGAWIGSGAIIMADVGANTVVGAGSVVTKALPDNVIAAGVPARVLRTRA